MTRLAFLLTVIAFPALACTSVDGLPDPSPGCTPGSVDPAVMQSNIATTICVPGYSKSVRPPVSVTNPMKRQVMQEYGMEGEYPATVEGDHEIPISIGGCAGPGRGCDFHSNYWPEPWQGPNNAHDKDKIEWALQRLVCSDKMPLVEAQRRISHDWRHALNDQGVAP